MNYEDVSILSPSTEPSKGYKETVVNIITSKWQEPVGGNASPTAEDKEIIETIADGFIKERSRRKRKAAQLRAEERAEYEAWLKREKIFMAMDAIIYISLFALAAVAVVMSW